MTSLLFVCALELRVADEQRENDDGTGHHVIRHDVGSFLVLGHLTELAQAFGQRGAQALFVRATFGVRDGVTEELLVAILIIVRPGNGPLDAAFTVGKIGVAKEWRAAISGFLAPESCSR